MATATELVAGVGKLFFEGFIAFAAGWELWGSVKNFEIAGHTLNAYAGVATMAIAQQFDAMFAYIENGFVRMGGWLDRIGAKADAMVGLKGWAKEQSANAKAASADVAANNQAFTFRSHIRQSVATQDWNGTGKHGEPGAPTGTSPADSLFAQDMAALPAVPGGTLNPTGMGSRRAQAAKEAKAAADQRQKILDHLYAMADKGAAKATAIADKMNAAAEKLHLAFMAMTNPLGAKIAGVNLKYGGIAKEMTGAGHSGAAADALAIGQSKIMGIKYQAGMQHLGMLKANLHDTITGNAALVQTGAMTKMQAAQANISAQKQAAPAMVHILQTLIAMEKASAGYAHNMASQKIVANLKAQETTLKAMGSQLGYYSAKVKNVAQNAMTGLFQNMMHGQKTWGQMLYSFFASIGKGIENILAKSISQAIADSIMGKKTNQGIGSLIGGIAKWFGGLFGGSGTSATTISATGGRASSGPGIWSMISAGGGFLKDLFSVIGSFAVGADNIPHDMVAQIHKGEMIIPAGPAAAIRSGTLGSSNGAQNHLHLTIHAMDSQSVIGALHSVREEAAQMFINTAQHLNFNGG